jgi:hypothetical protein
MRSIPLVQSFMLISRSVPELFPGQSSKCKHEQKAMTSKLGKVELCFFCLLLNEIYLPKRFLVRFRVLSRTKFKVKK